MDTKTISRQSRYDDREGAEAAARAEDAHERAIYRTEMARIDAMES